MKRTLLIIIMVLVENAALFELFRLSQMLDMYEIRKTEQQGLKQVCSTIALGSDFDAVLRQVASYRPNLSFDKNGVEIYFMPDAPEGTGNKLIFDANKKLVIRKCGDKWLPDIEGEIGPM